jgi:hypothetical protein
MITGRRIMYMTGDLELRSPLFSNEWVLRQGDVEVARLRRRNYSSIVDLAAGGRGVIEPVADGTVHATVADREVARIRRRSWLGRHWEITGPGFAYDLFHRSTPRRWRLTLANGTIGEIDGAPMSYNRVRFHNQMAVPLSAMLLSWHVVARPWEAASEPRVLVPAASGTQEAVLKWPDAGG